MESDVPTGFNIQVVRHPEAVTYSWSALERHPIQWIPLGFGVLMLIQAVAMPIMFFTNIPNDLDKIPLALACIFLTAIGATLAWSGYSRRGCEVVELQADGLTYDNGPTVMPLPVMLFFGMQYMLIPTWTAGDSAPMPHFRRRRRSFSRESIGAVTLDRIGVRQRLRFDCGRDRIEIGFRLSEPEREWLFQEIVRWQQPPE